MKYVRLIHALEVKIPVAVPPGDEPYHRTLVLPEYTKVEVVSELGGKLQVCAHVVQNRRSTEALTHEFELWPEQVFVPKGQLVSVYRDASGYDGSLNGLGHRYERMVLCGPGMGEQFAESSDLPALRLWKRSLAPYGQPLDYIVAVPYDQPWGTWSFGGNFVHSIDSRVRASLPPYGICPIHDRDMGLERR